MTGGLTTVDEKPDTPSYPLILLPTSFALEETTKYRGILRSTTGSHPPVAEPVPITALSQKQPSCIQGRLLRAHPTTP